MYKTEYKFTKKTEFQNCFQHNLYYTLLLSLNLIDLVIYRGYKGHIVIFIVLKMLNHVFKKKLN
jgi:hypothetical protein